MSHKKKLKQIRKNSPTSVEFGGEISILEAREGESTPRFEIQAYNGGKLPVKGFDYPVVVELASASFEREVTKINRNHDQQREVGHTETQEITTTGIELTGALSVPGKDRDDIVSAAKAKFPWDASIEAQFPKPTFIERGRQLNVNGQMLSGPFYFARNAQITGTAILNRGADRNTVVKIAAEQGIDSMNKELKNFIVAQGFDPVEVEGNDNKLAFFQASFDDSKQSGDGPIDFTKKMREEGAAESERQSKITSICAEFGNPTIKLDGQESPVSLAAHAISTGMTEKECKLEAKLFDLDRKSGGSSPAIHVPGDVESSIEQETLCASLAMTHFGITEDSAGKSYSDRAMNEASTRRNRQQSLHSVMGRICAAAGMPYHGAYKSMEFWQHTLEAQQKLQASGTSTLSLPNLFENVLNKVQLDSFLSVPQMWRDIAWVSSVSDFKKTSRVRLTAKGGYRKVGKDGEIKHVGLTDAKRSNQAETFGAIMSLTRVDIINDDMGALQQIAAMLGMMAGQKIEEETWVTFLANAGNFFSAGNKNLLAGTALDIPGLGAARDKFLNRVDSNKKPITVGPALLVTGIPQTDAANDLYTKSEYAIGNTASGDKLKSTKNNHVGKYMPVISPWVSNTDIRTTEDKSVPNQSSTDFYLLSMATAMCAAIEVVFLNGMQSPTTSTSDMEFNKLGIQYRSYHDFGVEYGDEEAAVKVTA